VIIIGELPDVDVKEKRLDVNIKHKMSDFVDVKVEMSDLVSKLETNSELIALRSTEFKEAQNQIEKLRYKSSFMIF